MKKEVFLAVAVGFVLGLLITFGIWTANRSLKNTFQPEIAETSPSPSPEPESIVPAAFSLTIVTPEDEALVTTSEISVSGKTVPQAVVVIMSENSEQIVTTDSTGAFTADVTLEGGYNRLQVTAFDATGSSTSQTLLVTYTTSKI